MQKKFLFDRDVFRMAAIRIVSESLLFHFEI